MRYRCLECEDPCVLEIAMKATVLPDCCPWGEHENPAWAEWEESQQENEADCEHIYHRATAAHVTCLKCGNLVAF